ncbi:Pyridine nucleotide-disulfide oxidoreductase domain-containing protein 2 [Amphibalanus amphitrite]|uniref:Pyridine nucleotide-disulfide oxidoreductase domain-containing protein 2 n=1 Tax=Amphibalanus amphitrite TaxID=1232801 RepID=A0A6A4VMJ3_AMPAM|nr:Pyridine nucleotide-disulfide oxidoreductase domain-containing protein 2 [Amphibalanus amphitrite]
MEDLDDSAKASLGHSSGALARSALRSATRRNKYGASASLLIYHGATPLEVRLEKDKGDIDLTVRICQIWRQLPKTEANSSGTPFPLPSMRLPVCGARAARRLWSTAGVSGPRALHMTCRRGTEATTTPADQLRTEYDAVIVGAGHNGLVCAAYLQAQGLQTCVLERRHLVGGAAVTEEVVPGYKFSRASYLLSLLRPQIAADLELKRHGLKVHLRNPSSYTPLRPEFRPASGATSLTLSADHRFNQQQIGRFSERDAQVRSGRVGR